MKIDAKNTSQIIREMAEVSKFKAVLLYGEDNSSLEMRYREIVDIFREKNYELVDLTPEDIRGREGFLIEKFVSIPMFSSGTLFKLKLLGKGNSYSKYVENLFKNNDLSGNSNFLLMTAELLDTSSSLRKYAEKSRHIACIPCYEENSRDISSFVRKKLKEYNFNFDSSIVEYISSISSSTVMVANELYKLDLYLGESRNLNIDDIRNCLVDTSVADLDNFIENFCSLSVEKTYESLDKIFCGGTEPIVVVRTMLRHFLLLQKIYFLLDGGDSLESIFISERLFWKLQISLKSYLRNWNLEKINFILEEMIEVEKNTKFSPKGRIILEKFILHFLMSEINRNRTRST
ncbi:MAG: DNA polymerase III subunit delta [Rickettsiales bacterium]|jgi:DNA polymerase III delta subunit|nr:DNA polymerase III subunit delta [Rickettsiales bacterium]